jgi:hypothetical protein
MGLPPITPDELHHRRTRLADALFRKQRALLQANICLAGGGVMTQQQCARNQTEATALGLKMDQVVHNGFNWPGDQAITTLLAKASAVYSAGVACHDHAYLLHECDPLIATLPASSI